MDNRSTILNCALELFAARGYDAVGVQEVAEAAGVTKPTLYHYYGSKQGLLRALLETYTTVFNQAVTNAAKYQGDLTLTLEKIARTYFEFARQNPVYYRMALAMYFAPKQSEAYQVISAANNQQYELVEQMFEAAVREHGNIRGKQRLLSATFIGMLNTAIGLWLNHDVELYDPMVYALIKQFQYGIYA